MSREKRSLQDWLEVSDEYQRRYEWLKDKANLQQWVRRARRIRDGGRG